MSDTKLVKRESPNSGLVLRDMASLRQFCETAIAAGMGGRRGNQREQVAQAIMLVQCGAEMGLGPMASLMWLQVIDGKPSVKAQGMAQAIKRHPRYDFDVVELSDERCTLRPFVDGKPRADVTFTMEQAKSANLLKNPTWKSYPQNMLFARAVSNAYRWYFSDALGGGVTYTSEEMADVVDHDVETGEVTGSPDLSDSPPATDPQRKKIHAAANEAGIPKDLLKQYMDARFGKVSTKALTVAEASALIEGIESDDVSTFCERLA